MRVRRFFAAVIFLAVAFPSTALAQDPEGCPGSIVTTDANGEVQNEYQVGEPVYITGQNFLPNVTLNYTVVHIQTGAVAGTGSFNSGTGNFTELVTFAPAPGRHEYKVIVEYTPPDEQPEECQKSDNFFAVGGAGELAETGFPALPIFLAGLGLLAVFLVLWLPRSGKRA